MWSSCWMTSGGDFVFQTSFADMRVVLSDKPSLLFISHININTHKSARRSSYSLTRVTLHKSML